MSMILTADYILGLAEKHKIHLTRGGTDHPYLCARGVLAYEANVSFIYDETVAQYFNVSYETIDAVEHGFEGFSEISEGLRPFYNLGKEVAVKAGLENY